MTRYTLHLTQPDGSYRVHVTGDGPADDTDTPALPDALLTALGTLYGDRWGLSALWAGGWRVVVDCPGQGLVAVGYIDTGPMPLEADPRQVAMFGAS